MRVFRFAILVFTILFLFSCQNNSKKGDITDPGSNSKMKIEKSNETTVKKIFFNLPSPIELTQTVLESKSPYTPELLNPVENFENYVSSSKLALNFGVYGADLCYCRVYDELQESISYLATIRKITEKLQIPESEGAETINRIEENIANSDSIFKIIADTYAAADGYLKENDRDLTATFILIGGWIEGMHFAVKINSESKNQKQLISRIAEQKFSLQNLMNLINEYGNNSNIAEIKPLFEKLEKVYENIEISYDKAVVVTDQETKKTTIDNTANIKITDQQLDEISGLVNEIRSKIIG